MPIRREGEVIIFYKNDKFNPFILRRQFTELDFFSYTGGALGLFLGFSVLSFIEIIYYLTIRICFEKYRLRRVGVQGLTEVSRSNYVQDYFASSSIHGMNHVIFKRRHFIERAFWFLLVCTSLIYCVISTINIHQNYSNAPIVTTFEDKPVSIENAS
jgi:Amiloride-sensitive sodium channel